MSHHERHEAPETQFTQLLALEPKLITNFVPSDGQAQKDAFLKHEITNPDHEYGKLNAIDFDEQLEEINRIGNFILKDPTIDDTYTSAYKDFITNYTKKTELMARAFQYKHAADESEKEAAREKYMTLNRELYGEPDEVTYRSLLVEKLNKINAKELSGKAQELRDELFVMSDFAPGQEIEPRFKPSEETVVWMHDVVNELYGGMLSHVPDQESFSPEELKVLFETILVAEFGEVASEWVVDIEKAQSITVKAPEKRIVIPEDRGVLTHERVRKLIVHEIGVHVLRSIMGEASDLDPLRTGLSNYYDSEEGLGMVMEQSLDGKHSEAGVDHYITAGLAAIDGQNFRGTFENKWRINALSKLKDNEELTDEKIKEARENSYKAVMRIFRGTDDLPWFKDLAYYNGSSDMWRHLEEIRGDDIKFMFVLLGKADPANITHQRIMLETKTA